MNRNRLILSLFTLLLFCSSVFSQVEEPMQYSQVKISLDSENTLSKLKTLGIDLMCGAHHDHAHKSIELVLSSYELGLLQGADLKYSILIEDLSKHTKERLQKQLPKAQEQLEENKEKSKHNPGQVSGCTPFEFPVPENFELGSMGGFTTYAEFLTALDAMKTAYPELISTKASISETQTTIEGRPIYFVRISDNPEIDEDEPEVLYSGIHHAREPVSMMSLLYYMWYLLENYASDPEIKDLIDNMELYFIPMINPDGYLYNEATHPEGGGNWRKNRRNNGNNTFGVDINRNYGFNWGIDDEGSSDFPGSNTYRGPAPFSEPETQMMRDFILDHDFKVAVNNHVYSEYILHPWGTEDSMPEEDEALYKVMGEHMTRDNRYYYGQTHFVIYDVNGDSNDWCYGEQEEKDKIFAFTPEIGLQSEGGFWPDPDLIVPQCQEQMHSFLSAAYFSMPFAILYDNTALNVNTAAPELRFVLEQISAVEGEYTISVEALSDHVLQIETQVLQSTTMQGHSFQEFTTHFELDEEKMVPGELIEFQVTLNNGVYDIHSEIISKYYYAIPMVEEDGEEGGLGNWDGDWIISASESHSGSFSFTESEGINSFGEKILEYGDPLDLSGIDFAFVEYFMKYDIQHQYDYVSFEASTNGVSWSPLCGKYSKAGSDSFVTGHPPSGQPEHAPIYDGRKDAWIREEIDLSDYLGEETVYLRMYSYTSSFYDNEQGFYFDDFRIIRNALTHCEDGIQNGDEAGLDCGGLDCLPCPTCNDGILNGLEIEVDCGGPDCPNCPYDPCPGIDFSNFDLLSFADQDFGFGTTIENGNGILVEDNAWKAIEYSYQITENTIVSFDFKSTEEAEIHEFLIDTDLQLDENSVRFRLYGTQNVTDLITDFEYSGSGAYESFTIPIGEFTTGNFNYFVFTADNDLDPNSGISRFRNFKIYEDVDNNLICDEAKADLTCSFTMLPSLSNGVSELSFIIQVQELIGLNTTDTIQIVLPKDERLSLDYIPDLMEMGPFILQNGNWEYDGSSPLFHVWKNGKELLANNSTRFGFVATFDPDETTGVSTFTITLLPGSGGEEYFLNNIDVERLNYFRE